MRLYPTPKGIEFYSQDIEEAAVQNGYPRKGFNRDFVVDLAIQLMGGEPLPEKEIKKAYTDLARDKVFVPGNPGKTSDVPTYFFESGTGSTTSLPAKKADWVISRTRESLDVQKIIMGASEPPGDNSSLSPLSRAFKVLTALREERRQAINEWKEGQQTADDAMMGGDAKDDKNKLEKITIFPHDPVLDGSHEEGADEYLDFLLSSQVAKNREGSIHDFTDKDLRELLKVASYMQDVRQISEAEHTYVEDPTGPMMRYKAARGLEDLERVDGEEMTMGPIVLAHNLICGETLLKTYYKQQAETSVINVLIDRSGSMKSESKSVKALGILWYLVKQVIKKKAIVIFSFFEETADNFHILDYRFMTSRELRTWFFKAMHNPFEGGTTEIGKASLQAIEKFKDLMATPDYKNIKVSKGHLVLINDGEDDASQLTVDALNELDAVLHGFILFNTNSHIRYLAEQTGGFYCEGI